jgi:uroporphyrinogen decarboxylase
MVEGHGSRDFAAARNMAFGDPALFAKLTRTLVEATTQYLLAQVEAGAEALMLFDSWSGLLPPSQFRRWVIEPTAEIVRNIRKAGITVPIIGFPRLAGPMLAEYAQRTGVQCLGIDTTMDLRWAATAVRPDQALQGNLDPLALIAGGAALETETRSILGAMRGRPYVFNLGHGIEKVTPPEHVAALVRLVRAG